ncbi:MULTISPECIES: DUF4157 domain-containing protein [unclassified Microcoleus]|uniref:DUF4157 domain-containing protein n=1 Tax=unclassified Microcoleus TaxID=2642155 RepID=UPI002FD18A06
MDKQSTHQKKPAPTRSHPTKTSVKSPVHQEDDLQGAIGNRQMGLLMETHPHIHPSSQNATMVGEMPMLGGMMPVSQGRIQRQPLFGGLSQEMRLENATLALPATGALVQRKLTLGTPGDMYEEEADRVARQVVDEIHSSPFREQNAQSEEERIPAGGEAGRVQRQITVRSAGDAGGELSSEWEGELQRAKSGGQPLSPSVKEPMERAFGADFGGVRVHTGAQADMLARSIQAKAFTTGQDVFFRQGAYESGSRGGQELIAHEMTHVVQQNGGALTTTLMKCQQKVIQCVILKADGEHYKRIGNNLSWYKNLSDLQKQKAMDLHKETNLYTVDDVLKRVPNSSVQGGAPTRATISTKHADLAAYNTSIVTYLTQILTIASKATDEHIAETFEQPGGGKKMTVTTEESVEDFFENKGIKHDQPHKWLMYFTRRLRNMNSSLLKTQRFPTGKNLKYNIENSINITLSQPNERSKVFMDNVGSYISEATNLTNEFKEFSNEEMGEMLLMDDTKDIQALVSKKVNTIANRTKKINKLPQPEVLARKIKRTSLLIRGIESGRRRSTAPILRLWLRRVKMGKETASNFLLTHPMAPIGVTSKIHKQHTLAREARRKACSDLLKSTIEDVYNQSVKEKLETDLAAALMDYLDANAFNPNEVKTAETYLKYMFNRVLEEHA